MGPDGLRVQTFDNGTAWMGDGKTAEDVPPEIGQALQAGVQRDSIALLLAMADKKVSARRIADVTVGGTPLAAIEVDVKPAGKVTLGFDPKSGLLLYQRYGGGAGEPDTEEIFADYRPVQGLQVAHRLSVRRQGQFPVQRTIRTFEVNVPLDAALFHKPTGKLVLR